MKKLLFISLAVLLIAGSAYAISLPQSEVGDSGGPFVWTQQVYNNTADSSGYNSSATLDVGDVVVWDILNSTGDNDNYVTLTTTADTYLVAGVVYPNAIAAGDTGTIAIRGVVKVDIAQAGASNITLGSLVCTSTTAGAANVCSSSTSDTDAIGFAVAAPGSADVLSFINIR